MNRYKPLAADRQLHEKPSRRRSWFIRLVIVVVVLAYAFYYVLGRDWRFMYQHRLKGSDIIHVK